MVHLASSKIIMMGSVLAARGSPIFLEDGVWKMRPLAPSLPSFNDEFVR